MLQESPKTLQPHFLNIKVDWWLHAGRSFVQNLWSSGQKIVFFRWVKFVHVQNLPSQALPTCHNLLLNKGRQDSQCAPSVLCSQTHSELYWNEPATFLFIFLRQHWRRKEKHVVPLNGRHRTSVRCHAKDNKNDSKFLKRPRDTFKCESNSECNSPDQCMWLHVRNMSIPQICPGPSQQSRTEAPCPWKATRSSHEPWLLRSNPEALCSQLNP